MTVLLILAATLAVSIASAALVVNHVQRRHDAEDDADTFADPDRHRAANLPSLYRGWEGK